MLRIPHCLDNRLTDDMLMRCLSLFVAFQNLNSGMNIRECEDQFWLKVQMDPVFRFDWCKMFSLTPWGYAEDHCTALMTHSHSYMHIYRYSSVRGFLQHVRQITWQQWSYDYKTTPLKAGTEQTGLTETLLACVREKRSSFQNVAGISVVTKLYTFSFSRSEQMRICFLL
jgi:hypothetical protein